MGKHTLVIFDTQTLCLDKDSSPTTSGGPNVSTVRDTKDPAKGRGRPTRYSV